VILGVGPTDRFSFVGAAKIWGDLLVGEVLKSGIVGFPVFKSDVGVVVVVGPTSI
jgi:hypothetical protein